MQNVSRCLFVSVAVCLLLPRVARAQMVVGPGAGSPPEVRLIEATGERTLLAYDARFLGGVKVTLADVDGKADIITAAGPGGGPHVEVFSGADLSLLASFYAYHPAFAGDINVDGKADIITGPGRGGTPLVEVFSGADLSLLASFYAYHREFTGGVNVAAGDINGDGKTDIITGAGTGGGPHVQVFSGTDLSVLANFYAYPAGFGGVSVGSVGDAAVLRFTSPSATTFTVGSAGSFTVTTAGLTTPTIMTSSALPAGVTLTDNADGTATLAGTPQAPAGRIR